MPKPAAKGKKLPTWAYIAAAGIGVLIVFFLFRGKGSSTDQTVPVTTQTPDNSSGTGSSSDTSSILAQLLMALSATGAATNNGSGGGQSGGGGDSSGGDSDQMHGPIPTGFPAHPQPPGQQGHCTPPQGMPDGSTYPCSWCQSGTATYHKGAPDLCA